jgi:hypothetical protein
MEIPAQKEEAIKKALSSLNKETITLRCMRDKAELIRLNVRNKGNVVRTLAVKISDEDEKYLTKP